MKRVASRVLGIRPRRLEPFVTVKHSITRFRITLEAYRILGDHADPIRKGNGKWLARNRLHQLPFSSAHRQILRRLGF